MNVIDFNYKLVKKYTVLLLFIPYIIFFMAFVFYMNVVFSNRFDPEWKGIGILLLIIQGFFAIYFLVNEGRQIVNDGLDYLVSFWNIIDIIPPIGIIVLLII